MLITIRVDLYYIRTVCYYFFIIKISMLAYSIFLFLIIEQLWLHVFFFVLVDIHKVVYGLAHLIQLFLFLFYM